MQKNKTVYRKVILIDLDGVLNEYKGNYDENFIPVIKQGAKEFLKNLSETFDIIIFTTRNRLVASKWLIKNEIDKYVKDITNVKIPAFIYIDDRCICFNGKFDDLKDEIKKFEVYWKREGLI